MRSRAIPVIGVGESTTPAVPDYLNNRLGIARDRFFKEVRPSWKLGIKYIWGDPEVGSFYYPFDSAMGHLETGMQRPLSYMVFGDQRDSTHHCALMDRDLSPCLRHPDGRFSVLNPHAYHVQNVPFLEHLEQLAVEGGVHIIESECMEGIGIGAIAD